MKVYFAHPITDYGTARQRAAIKTLTDAGHTVENPDQPHHGTAYKEHGILRERGANM